jgi:integrase
VRVRISFSSRKSVTGLKIASYRKIDTKTDTSINNKAPILHSFGGDLTKRWYIDYYPEGKRLRSWIASNPANTRQARAKKELERVRKLYKKISYNLTGIVARMTELSQRSIDTYLSDAKLFDKHYENYDQFTNYLIGRYHINTYRNKLGNYKVIFNWAVEKEILSDNPFGNTKLFKKKDTDAHYPFSEYERSILEPELKATNPELYLFTRFLYYTFSRTNELLYIRVKDINLRSRTIKVYASKVKTWIVKPILNPLMDYILDSGILNQPSHYYIFGKNLKPGPKVCAKNHATNKHREILKKLHLYREHETSLYAWKHTGNINAYLAKMDIKMIQLINGHTSIETTEIYLRKLGLFLQSQVYEIIF